MMARPRRNQEVVPGNWPFRNLPMYMVGLRNELEDFSVKDNDMLFWTPRGSKDATGNDGNPSKYHYVSFAFSTKQSNLSWKVKKYFPLALAAFTKDEFRKAVHRILECIREQPTECNKLLWQYWRYFDVLRFEYRKIFYREIQEYLGDLTSNPPISYEKNKKDRIFLEILTNNYCSTFVEANKQTEDLLNRLPHGYFDDPSEMGRFFRAFRKTFFTRLSVILNRNKYIYFDIVESRAINNPNICKELNKRNAIFKQVTTYLEKHMKVLKKEEWPWPLFHLVYSSGHFSEHYLIIFEAIEQFLPETAGKELEAVEIVIYLFPEFLLHLYSSIETFADDVVRPSIIVVEEENSTLQTIKSLIEKGYWMPRAGKLLCTALCAAAVRSYLFTSSEQIEDASRLQSVVHRNFRHNDVHHPDITGFPIKIGPFNGLQSYEIFVAECRREGRFFYQCIFGSNSVFEGTVHMEKGPVDDKTAITKEKDHPQEEEKKIYYLQRFLRGCPPVRELFNQPDNGYQQEAVLVFLKVIDSMTRFPSILVYYHLLKEFLTDEAQLKIRKGLRERKNAEKYFMDFFQQPNSNVSVEFKDHARSRPLIFYFCFVVSFNMATNQGDSQMQTEILQQFCKVLYEIPKLRKWVEDESNRDVIQFRTRLLVLLNSSSDYIPEQAKIMFKRPLSEILSVYKWKADISQFPKSSLEEIRPLGEGAQAEAALVRAPQFPMPLVAKYFGTSQEDTAAEIECLVKMQFNPHVVQIFGYIAHKDKFIGILMEYCRGGSLDKVIKDGAVKGGRPYTETDVVSWAAQAASGLNYLHSKGILHRDVKPPNMLLDGDHYILKMGDLGNSKILPEEQRLSGKTKWEKNKATEANYGTQGYLPADNDDFYSAPLDVFALGRSVWEMVTRVTPHDDLFLAAEAMDRPENVSGPVWAFVLRMMLEDKAKRPSMEECYKFFNENLRNLTK